MRLIRALLVATVLVVPGAASVSLASVSTCGNGRVDSVEECDDANLTAGDGCSAVCELENTSARCAGVATFPGTELDARLVVGGLTGTPVYIHAPPLDPSRLFIVERKGYIRVVRNGAPPARVFLDINAKVSDNGGEQGMLGMAFHPDYENNRRFFVNYIDNAGDSVLAQYTTTANPDVADPNSETILLIIDRPGVNHNGGQLAFGPDGYLYFSMGDSGGGGDSREVAQSDTSLLGKILRFDVDTVPGSYVIPPTNSNAAAGDPFGLVWAKGFRNPWRFAFDRDNGDLYIADVGQGEREEINYQLAASAGGENYGWPRFEGTTCFSQPCPDPPTGFSMPVHEYSHADGCSISGGFVYRGCALPDVRGTYFYGDFCTSFIRTLRVIDGVAQDHQDRSADLDPPGQLSITSITSFGEDARGELYIADFGGEVFKIVAPAMPTPLPSSTATRTGTSTRSPTPTRSPSVTHTATRTPTPTRTRSSAPPVPTATATHTPTANASTPTPTPNLSNTPTFAASPTPSPPPTAIASQTASPPPTAPATASHTPPPSTSSPFTPTSTATRTSTPAVGKATRTTEPSPTPTSTPFVPICTGDCDGDGIVAINEIVLVRAIAFDLRAASTCPAFQAPGETGVSALVRAVANALNGCATD